LNVSIEILVPADSVVLRRLGAGAFDRAHQGLADKFAGAQILSPGDLAGGWRNPFGTFAEMRSGYRPRPSSNSALQCDIDFS
jgi:hypothetical protein